jgi:hypothetical protein
MTKTERLSGRTLRQNFRLLQRLPCLWIIVGGCRWQPESFFVCHTVGKLFQERPSISRPPRIDDALPP